MHRRTLALALCLTGCATGHATDAGTPVPSQDPAPTAGSPDGSPNLAPAVADSAPARSFEAALDEPTPSVPDAGADSPAPDPGGDPLQGAGLAEKVGGAAQPAFGSVEGPFWRASSGTLLFCGSNVILALAPPAVFSTFRKLATSCSGLYLDRNDRLVVADWEGHRVVRIDGDRVDVLADRFEGKPLQVPNDIVMRGDGTVFFTDIGLPGVFRLSPDGKLDIVVDARKEAANPRPNGVQLSPDESTLYVGYSGLNLVRRHAVAPDGSLGPGSKFADRGVPDGIAVDDAANVYLAGSGGVDVRRPDGSLLGHIAVPTFSSNVSFGGADRRTLYITTENGLYSIRLAIPGRP